MAQYWYFNNANLLEGSGTPSPLQKAYGTLFIEDTGTDIYLKFIREDKDGKPSEITLCKCEIQN